MGDARRRPGHKCPVQTTAAPLRTRTKKKKPRNCEALSPSPRCAEDDEEGWGRCSRKRQIRIPHLNKKEAPQTRGFQFLEQTTAQALAGSGASFAALRTKRLPSSLRSASAPSPSSSCTPCRPRARRSCIAAMRDHRITHLLQHLRQLQLQLQLQRVQALARFEVALQFIEINRDEAVPGSASRPRSTSRRRPPSHRPCAPRAGAGSPV